jgi:hypothetical protein
MGLFKKKKEVKEAQKAPNLPELPKLPDLKGLNNSYKEPKSPREEEFGGDFEESPRIESYHKLPSFPNNDKAEKFSQNTIKHAIEGDKKDFEEEPVNSAMPQIPATFPSEEYLEEPSEIPEPPKQIPKPTRRIITKQEEPSEKGPVFIRIDKFEESIKFIKKAKDKISEVERLLSETKDLKDKEQKEIEEWEQDLLDLKSKIERIERNLTSKL